MRLKYGQDVNRAIAEDSDTADTPHSASATLQCGIASCWRRCRASPMRRSAAWCAARRRPGRLRDDRQRSAGRRPTANAVLRAEGQGTGIHVVQLAGCEPHWMAEGARIAEGAGADIIDINMGCPAKHVDQQAIRLGADARSRSCAHADRGHRRRRRRAGDAEDAARLGRRSINAPELARRAEAAGVRMITRARPHALPVLHGHGRLGGGARGQGRGVDSGRRQRRHRQLRRCRRGARDLRRRRRDDRPRARRGGRGFPARSRAISKPAEREAAPPLADAVRAHRRALRRDAGASRRCASACGMPASISAGRSTPRR